MGRESGYIDNTRCQTSEHALGSNRGLGSANHGEHRDNITS